ncbi:1-deoxy-D-xylulose-5-phosphate synthase [Malacoplasma penetrans]|uniref:1-deoxy-D-xylulose-5-phosphate synthase n=1 Tax=Malacoplasma penetrans (strain HF-2) TaxID=272633 RepID=DXS_MALP2|nr:1-deoxy-D-xylulose-5-phosphate synthase [Malacoplasma penetrans]Q8EWX7.1 RecName: Full=1-deoxy-D-xylulose-5-phosphate synthase; AltName: Full=1-deoxyxylulose-5-phosphate synthase; Short=DXP synthase; Short=DXPS [Malacoplasma penetrans HF-2]RXY97348.1 1-deoxy-D-xylulose-5-phosphate synthase [Malacoplasma penetrans]BAC43863.1 deoxyxylulose-5-phosphate synthase [Malacoplasma penetrans HF-2]
MKKNKVKIDKIPNYEDFKKMKLHELLDLAVLLRKKIIDISENKSAHLSSNLGIVELSMALLYVFDSPQDLIAYDTGHQCYVHKMITDRADKISTIRESNGLSGFQEPNESIHDFISTGHSGNILSICQGFIEKNNSKSKSVIPVIGDAAISNGLAFEALNNIAYNKTPMLIIINDNGMSISKNVGALHKIMSKFQMSKSVFLTEKILRKILFKKEWSKKIYWSIYKSFSKLSKFFKGKNFFESLGFHYFGVIDGNNLKKTINVLKRIKNIVPFGPTILHVKTIKGLGYKEAELDDKGLYHSLKLSDPNLNSNNQTYGSVAANFLEKLIEYDNNIQIINPAMTLSSNFLNLSKKFPNNYEDVGIAEEHAVTKAAGMAIANKKVFVSIYSTFLQRSYDNLLHDVARLELPITFLVDRCDLSYSDGDTHHGIYDIGFLKSIPNTIITCASNKFELERLIILAYQNKSNPFFIRYTKEKCEDIEVKKEFSFGSWVYALQTKESKTCIISYGDIINDLKKEIKTKSIDLINAVFITNYQKENVLRILSTYKNIYVVEKVFDSNCLGDDLIILANENKLSCNIKKINIRNNKIGFGNKEDIDKKLNIDMNSIFAEIKS